MTAGLAFALICAGTAGPASGNKTPGWMWGVTIDNLDVPEQIAESLAKLPSRPTVRLVFDASAGPEYYRESVRTVRRSGTIMGEPIDSGLTKRVSLQQYRDRMLWYMEELKGDVDIWEIGNEINGDWGGESEEVAAKVAAAYDEAAKRKVPSAITLFYSDHYRDNEREMDAWSRAYLPARVRNGVDYVLVSFYPASPSEGHPDWKKIFARLSQTFPSARLGFGELGLMNPDFTLNKDLKANQELIRRYYRLKPPIDHRYVGGYFWWSYRQDAVPHGQGLWSTFEEVMRN